jgi:hypothetical protein
MPIQPEQALFRLPSSPGNRVLCARHPKSFSLSQGIPVIPVLTGAPGFGIHHEGRNIQVQAEDLSAWYRALGELAAQPGLKHLERQPPLKDRALMVDCSRNAVLRPEFLAEKVFPDLALMGYNAFCLYTEDTYEVEGHPLIGYRRGRYSEAELRQLGQRAAELGLEMFPCIQTLGHLYQVLKFKKYWPLRDTAHTLSTLNPKSYALLRDMIRSASRPYQSRRIHIGMDETADIGRGSSFRARGVDPRGLYLSHLKKVAALCQGLGLKPVMWGDMLLHFGAPARGRSPLPANMDVVYWSYWDDKAANHSKSIAKFQAWGSQPWVAPACLTEDRLWSLYAKVETAAGALLRAAKQKKVQKAMMTMWGDDGADAPFQSALPALAYFADHCWMADPPRRHTADLTRALSGMGLDDFLLPSDLECLDKVSRAHGANPSRGLFYDDPLLRIYAAHLGSRRLGPRLQRTAKALAKTGGRAPAPMRKLFAYARHLAAFLSLKADLGNRAAQAYRLGRKAGLQAALKDLPEARRRLRRLWLAHRAVWLEERRSIGLEVLDQRYGAGLARLEVMEGSLRDHLAGRSKRIEEYDEADQRHLGSFPDIYWLWRTWGIVSSGGTVL